MKIGIASHVVLDTIQGAGGIVVESIGGPPCYCGITARRFGFDVELATKVGGDFPDNKRNVLRDNNITLREWHVAPGAKTTRFGLEMDGDVDNHSRRLVLQAKCEPIAEKEVHGMKVDCWLVSPVIDEVPANVLRAIIKDNRGKKNFVMLDPQGYMRVAGPQDGAITFRDSLDIDLAGITAVKADSQELLALTGAQGVDGMKMLQSRGAEFVLATEHRIIHLLNKDMHYWIKLREVDTPDSTGGGDILSAAFACAWMREKDPLWAICFAAGALRAALETKQAGLGKIPPMNKIEASASYFYNTVGFQNV